MNTQVKQTLAKQGYAPIRASIDNSIRDLKRSGYFRGEILETLTDMYGDDGVLTRYIYKQIDLVR
jgi:hypothetical protein